MAVYCKFESEKNYSSICADAPFITVAYLKDQIFQSRYVRGSRCTDRFLEITNAQTKQVYHDEGMLIPKSTSVLVRRLPAFYGMRYIVHHDQSKVECIPRPSVEGVSSVEDVEPSKLDDEFGDEIYATFPEPTPPVQASNAVRCDLAPTKDDEDSRFKTVIETPASYWQSNTDKGFGPGRGFGRGDFNGIGRAGFEWRKPPQGYVCHRCNEPGHFIQHCPTNGNPDYDIKKVMPPTGIPKTMLTANPEGSYVLPNGGVATVKPDEGTFEKEIERFPATTRLQGDLPPELYCLLCKEVMKDAVLTGKCCFQSFCYNCIRDYIISKSICFCGAKDVLVDSLIPNKTLRDTINRILESSTNSSSNSLRSNSQLRDKGSATSSQSKSSSPTQSATSKGADAPREPVKETPKPVETADEERSAVPLQLPTQQTSDKSNMDNVPDILEATHDTACTREPCPSVDLLKKMTTTEVKTKNKKARLPASDMQCKTPQDFAADRFMMPMCPSTYQCDPYCTRSQPGMEMHMAPYGCGMPFDVGYGSAPMNIPFPCAVPNDPFMAQNPLFHMVSPQGEIAGSNSTGFNVRPPSMTREESEGRKADLKQKREIERLGESREMPKSDQGRQEINSVNIPSMKPKSNTAPSSNKRNSEHRRPPSSNNASVLSMGRTIHRKKHVDYDDSSDDDRHFKRKRSRYEPSPTPPQEVDCRWWRVVRA